jgi:hypothetical protein
MADNLLLRDLMLREFAKLHERLDMVDEALELLLEEEVEIVEPCTQGQPYFKCDTLPVDVSLHAGGVYTLNRTGERLFTLAEIEAFIRLARCQRPYTPVEQLLILLRDAAKEYGN